MVRVGTGPADDYYALLGVEADADIATLRRAFRQLALRWHPDRAGTDTTVIFQKISAAYEVLADPVRRADYDRISGVTGRRFQARAAQAEAANPEAPPRRRAPGVLLSRMCRSLTILLAMGSARRADDGVIELLLEPWEATQGGMITISMRVLVRCPACAGTGCDPCGSQGTVEELYSAWLAVPPEVTDGTALNPSVRLPGMIEPVSFRIRIAA